MRRLAEDRGTALVAVLSVALILLPIAAFVAWQARMDSQVEENLQAEITTFYVAEAGIEHALAEIPPGRGFDRLLAGPDGVAGTGDDGEFPFAEGAPTAFPRAPFRYAVHVSPAAGGRIRLTSEGSGALAATKVIEVLVTRAPSPATPAALYVAGDAADLQLDSPDFLISGFDHRPGDPLERPGGSSAAVAALATPLPGSAAALTARLSAAAAARLVGAAGVPSVATAPPPTLDDLIASCAGRPEAVHLGTGATGGLGTAAAPQLSVADGDLDVAGDVTGNGILAVRGALRVSGRLSFSGLVIAGAGVTCGTGSTVAILGALWQMNPAVPLQLGGAGSIAYSSSVLEEIDRLVPDLLPHAAVVIGWHEQA